VTTVKIRVTLFGIRFIHLFRICYVNKRADDDDVEDDDEVYDNGCLRQLATSKI